MWNVEAKDIYLECGCQKQIMGVHKHCPDCNSAPKDHEVRNYDPSWGGDVCCKLCGTYVRDFDAG